MVVGWLTALGVSVLGVLPVISQIPHVILFSILIASAIQWRYTKLAAFAFHALSGAILLIFPSYVNSPTIIGSFDAAHYYLQRFPAAFHIGFAVFNFRNQHDKIRTEPVIHLAKAVAAALLLITKLLTAYHMFETKARGIIVSPNYLSCALLVDGTWLAVETYRLFKQGYSVGDEIDIMVKRTQSWIEGRTSRDSQIIFWVDSAASFIYAFLTYGFPAYLIKFVTRREYNVDLHHELFEREFACHSLVPAIISLVATQFPVNHQKSYIIQRIVTQSIIFGLHFFGHFVLGIYNVSHLAPLLVSGFYISLLICIYIRVNNELQTEQASELNGPHASTTYTVKKTTKAL
ncbi:hypothetical protein Ddc_13941 [Ditylenchus destructor]|nr:hypothetical protein Ddc_13941 [Ditylenchus destructor]